MYNLGGNKQKILKYDQLFFQCGTLVFIYLCLVCRSGGTGIPNSHLHRLIIPDDVLTQFDLLMMSAVTLETRRDMK